MHPLSQTQGGHANSTQGPILDFNPTWHLLVLITAPPCRITTAIPMIYGLFCNNPFCSFMTIIAGEIEHGLHRNTQNTVTLDLSLPITSIQPFRCLEFPRFHLSPAHELTPKWCLPLFSRYTRLGCSRFPPCCSGTPATNVCCSSPGLGSFLRPQSAASLAPWIGKHKETGTCFIKNMKH